MGVPSESHPSAFCIDKLGRSLPPQRHIELVGIGLHACLDHVEGTVCSGYVGMHVCMCSCEEKEEEEDEKEEGGKEKI